MNLADLFATVPMTAQTIATLFSLACSCLAIPLMIVRVLPKSQRNGPYYVSISIQLLIDLLQTLAVVIMTCITEKVANYKIKYTGILLFEVSVMITAILAIYWMDLLIRSKTVKKFLHTMVATVSVPMLVSTVYLILMKDSTDDIQNFEWMLMSASRTVAQMLFAFVIFTTSYKVFHVTAVNSTMNIKRTYRKVWKGLVFKSVISVGVAIFGMNTFVGILANGNLIRYMAENSWWSHTYFAVNTLYCGVNTLITVWMLIPIIMRKKSASSTSVTPIDRSLKAIQSARRI